MQIVHQKSGRLGTHTKRHSPGAPKTRSLHQPESVGVWWQVPSISASVPSLSLSLSLTDFCDIDSTRTNDSLKLGKSM